MSTTACAVAADTKLETPEGPLTIKTVGASPTSVMTVNDDGAVRFALSTEVHKVADAQPVLRITLENGRALRVGAEQVLLKAGREARAPPPAPATSCSTTSPSRWLQYRTDGARTSSGTVKMSRSKPAAQADVYSLKIPRTAASCSAPA
jgi:hypothetical protein